VLVVGSVAGVPPAAERTLAAAVRASSGGAAAIGAGVAVLAGLSAAWGFRRRGRSRAAA
jgi:hypothetical protein